MQDTLKTGLALLAGALLTLALTQGPRAEAQDRAQAKWDYKVLRLDPRDYEDKLDWKEAQRLGGVTGAEAVFYEHVLDTLATQGWELVQSEQRTPTVTYFYLRKPAR